MTDGKPAPLFLPPWLYDAAVAQGLVSPHDAGVVRLARLADSSPQLPQQTKTPS